MKIRKLLMLLLSCFSLGPKAQDLVPPFEFVGSFGEPITTSCASEKTAYVAQGPNVRIIDITDPVHTHQVQSISFNENVSDIVSEGKVLYVALSAPGRCAVHIFDVSDPNKPRRLQVVKGDSEDERFGFEKIKNYLWVREETYRSYPHFVFDISDPLKPERLDKTTGSLESSDKNIGYIITEREFSFDEKGEITWVHDDADDSEISPPPERIMRLHVIDRTSPLEPKDIRQLSVGKLNPDYPSTYYDVEITKSALWIWQGAHRNEFGALCDISDPRNPILRMQNFDEQMMGSEGSSVPNQWVSQIWTSDNFNVVDVQTSGTVAYLADRDFGLRVFDIANTANVSLLGSLRVNRVQSLSKGDNAIIIGGTANNPSNISIVDVDDPTSLALRSLVLPGPIHGIAVRNNIAYAACGEAGLMCVDLTDPRAPSILARQAMDRECTDVAVSDHYLFAADGKLRVYDISNPGKPVPIVKDFDFGMDARHLKLDDHRMILFSEPPAREDDYDPLIHQMPSFSVVDITNPALPKLLGRNARLEPIRGRVYDSDYEDYGFSQTGAGVAVQVLLAPIYWRTGFRSRFYDGNIYLYDLSKPDGNFDLLGMIHPPYAPEKIHIRDDMMFVSGVQGGLMMYRQRAR